MTINLLGRDVLTHIFSLLELPDISSCARTCTWWRQITQDERLWQVFCHKLGHMKEAYPGSTWHTSCKIYAGKIFTHGAVTTSSIQIPFPKNSLYPSVTPAVHNDRLAYYQSKNDTIELHNWIDGGSPKEFKTTEGKVPTPWLLSYFWEKRAHLQLNEKYLVYVVDSHWAKASTVYIWDPNGKSELPAATFSLPCNRVLTQLSNDTLFVHSFEERDSEGVLETAHCSLFDLTDLSKINGKNPPQPECSRTLQLKKASSFDKWHKIPIVCYQNRIFYFENQIKRDSLQSTDFRGWAARTTNPSKPPSQDKFCASRNQLDGKYFYTFRISKSEKSSTYYCSCTEVWDLENCSHSQKERKFIDTGDERAHHLNIDEKLFVTKGSNSITLFKEDLETSRTLSFPEGLPTGTLFSFRNGILVLGGNAAFAIKFT